MTLRHVVLAVLAAAALWFGYRWLFPDDEAQIREVLEKIADVVSSSAEQQSEVARVARAAGARNYFDPQVTVDAGPPFSRMSGRDAIIGSVARMNSATRDLDVDFVDVQVAVNPDRLSASVYLTAEARFTDARGARGVEARELDVLFKKLDGDWVVSTVSLVRTLDPLTPR